MKAAILDILSHSERPIKRIQLLWLLHSRYIEIDDRAMRKAIEEMIEEGECIASSKNGYHLIRNEEQVIAAVTYLKTKAKSIAIRGNCIIRNWRKKHPESTLQLELF